MELKRFKFIDKPFLIVLAIIIVIGFVVLVSATNAISSDPYFYLKKQLFTIFLGIGISIFIIRYDYAQLSRYNFIIYGMAIVMLVAVLIFGEEVRGTTGWITIGPLPAFQVAEFTKIMLIIAFADFLSKRRNNLDTLTKLIPCFIFMGIPFLLVMVQPDLGTALVYIAITLVMMFMAGANPKIMITIITSVIALTALILFLHFQYGLPLPLETYQIKRLTMFIDPYADGQGGRGAGWNTIQSLIAVGSGGLFGKGLFNGTQVQLNFLPEHHTDFIYSVIGEELGFIGAAFVIILFGILLLRTVYIALNAKDFYGTLIVLGISAMWLFHVYENIGMSIGIMPITGIPLPFLSYGGSAMLTNIVAAGVILSVNIRGKKIVF
ncbi:MAG TPA: rod shape-determining protein RodA [Syntrophomonadaceae bacterium]|nr:rod shape-determining protein RodA [Syntrophomonadaceae bacterium]